MLTDGYIEHWISHQGYTVLRADFDLIQSISDPVDTCGWPVCEFYTTPYCKPAQAIEHCLAYMIRTDDIEVGDFLVHRIGDEVISIYQVGESSTFVHKNQVLRPKNKHNRIIIKLREK